MASVHIAGVDERDSSWEDHAPRFRVYLQGSGDSTTAGWTDAYDLTGADVLQVIDWAQRQAGDTLTYAIALVYDDDAQEALNPGCGRGLVWLVGMDGNGQPATDQEADVQHRMLARREDPVILPAADRIPTGLPQPDDCGMGARTVCQSGREEG